MPTEDRETESRPTATPMFSPNGLIMTLRPFDGKEDVRLWMDHAEAVQELNGWSEKTLTLVVKTSLQGNAARWWHAKKTASPEVQQLAWNELKQVMLSYFEDESADSLLRKAYRTPQGNRNVKTYTMDLEAVFARAPGFPESEKLRVFINNLRPDLRNWVVHLGAEDLPTAIKIAKRSERATEEARDTEDEISRLHQKIQELSVKPSFKPHGGAMNHYRTDNLGKYPPRPPRNELPRREEYPKETRRLPDGADRRQ